MNDYKKIVGCDDMITIRTLSKINFFLNKYFLKYARLMIKITGVAVVEKHAVELRLRLFDPSLP